MCNGAATNNNHAVLGNNTNSSNQPDLNNWLPITASRKAKWYYSTFHNVTAMVGAGVLGLPYAMSQLGWIPGIIVIFSSWLITFYSLWQLVNLHEVVPGKRFDRYPELGQHAFGETLGYWIVMPQQLLVQVASDVIYMVTGGKSLQKFVELAFPEAEPMRLTYYIVFFAVIQILLSQTPNFNSLKVVSLLAAVMSVSYSLIGTVASTVKGLEHHGHEVDYSVRSTTTTGKVFDVLNGFGTVAFAFAGHSVVLEIQATIPSTPDKPSKIPMWKGVVTAYFIVAACYFAVSISGFWAFGNEVEDDVLISLVKPAWVIAAANLFVFVHVIGSYQVFAMPVFDKLESYLVQNLKFKPGRMLRLIARSIYVILTAFTGICVPFFGGLLGFFGGLVFASTSYFMPCICWLIIHRPKIFSFHWIACWISIIVGVSIAILAPIGGMRTIILSAKSYKMFS
ncbi:hypothetical protein ACFE04_007911 [Oxalis oulophora]